jgi:hypothetical protein
MADQDKREREPLRTGSNAGALFALFSRHEVERVCYFDELSPFDKGWLVGLLEGEGCFTTQGKGRRGPRISIEMNDQGPVEKVARIWDRQHRSQHKPSARAKGYQNTYCIAISGVEAAVEMRAMQEFMSPRRQERIQQLLDLQHNP